jgi:hypothetical protein
MRLYVWRHTILNSTSVSADGLKEIFSSIVAEKSKSKFLDALCYFENPLCNALQRLYSGDFDPESRRDP